MQGYMRAAVPWFSTSVIDCLCVGHRNQLAVAAAAAVVLPRTPTTQAISDQVVEILSQPWAINGWLVRQERPASNTLLFVTRVCLLSLCPKTSQDTCTKGCGICMHAKVILFGPCFVYIYFFTCFLLLEQKQKEARMMMTATGACVISASGCVGSVTKTARQRRDRQQAMVLRSKMKNREKEKEREREKNKNSFQTGPTEISKGFCCSRRAE